MFRIPDPNDTRPGAPWLPFTRVGPLGLALALGVVVLAIFVLNTVGRSPGAGDAAVEPDRLGRAPQVEFLDEGELAAQYPTTVRDELREELTSWFQTPGREAISDRVAEEEPEWLRHLLSDAVRPRLERLPGWVFDEIGDVTRLVEEPGSHRGRLVQAWGAVRSVEEVLLATDPPVPGWRIRLDDPEGRSWTVVSPAAPPPGVRTGNWVKAFGVFVKLSPLEEGRVSLVLLTPRRVLASFPPRRVTEIDPSWAAEVSDDTIEQSQRRPADEEAFWLLLNHIATLGPEGYREKVRSGALKVTDLTTSRGMTDLAQQPALHRFELVRVRVGISQDAGRFESEEGLPENPGNIRSVVRGYVLDDQQRVAWVLSPFPASELNLAGARLAIVEGFFYKRMATETRDPAAKGKLYWMPVILATSIRPVEIRTRTHDYAAIAAWTAIVAAVGCVALFVVLTVRSRRQARETQRRHMERASRRKAEPRAADPGAADRANPPS